MPRHMLEQNQRMNVYVSSNCHCFFMNTDDDDVITMRLFNEITSDLSSVWKNYSGWGKTMKKHTCAIPIIMHS